MDFDIIIIDKIFVHHLLFLFSTFHNSTLKLSLASITFTLDRLFIWTAPHFNSFFATNIIDCHPLASNHDDTEPIPGKSDLL
jgi:hypothetical protein